MIVCGRYQTCAHQTLVLWKGCKKKGVKWGVITGPYVAVVLLAG